MVRPVNLPTLLICSYNVTYVEVLPQRIFRVCFSLLPTTKRGGITCHICGTPLTGFSVISPQGGSCWLVKMLTLLCGSYSSNCTRWDCGNVILGRAEQGTSDPPVGLILSHAFSHSVGSCVPHDYYSTLSLRFTFYLKVQTIQWFLSGVSDSSLSISLVHISRWTICTMYIWCTIKWRKVLTLFFKRQAEFWVFSFF